MDIIAAIDPIMEKKLDSLVLLDYQFYDGGANGSIEMVPTDPAKQQERRKLVRATLANRYKTTANTYRAALADWYGVAVAEKIQHAEAFEICEYGRRPDKAELKKLFPFFP